MSSTEITAKTTVDYPTVADRDNGDPFDPPPAAACEHCGDSALKSMPAGQAPAEGVQYICSDCYENGSRPGEQFTHHLVEHLARQAHGFVARAVAALEANGYDPRRIEIEPCGMAVEVDLVDTMSELGELSAGLTANGQLHRVDEPDDSPFVECRCGCGDWHRRAAVAHYLDEDRKFTPGDRVTVPDFVRPPNWPDWWTVDSWACGELRDADGPVYGVRPGNGVLGNDPTLLFAESELRSWVEPPKKTEAAGVLNGAQEVQS